MVIFHSYVSLPEGKNVKLGHENRIPLNPGVDRHFPAIQILPFWDMPHVQIHPIYL
jgi:hypothetical protein